MDVQCIVCTAQPFEPCVYTNNAHNRRLNRVGQPITFGKRTRSPQLMYHTDRKWDQFKFDETHWWSKQAHAALRDWLREYAHLLTGRE